MAYNQNIPQANDQLSVSQGDLLNNFLAIFNAFNLNHGDFNSITEGKHKFLQMPIQSTAVITNTTEVGLYSRTSPVTNSPQLAYRRANNGSIYEFTSAGPYITSQLMVGWAQLPSGILMKWGSATVTGAGTVNYPTVDVNGNTVPLFSNISGNPLAFVSPTNLSGSSDVSVIIQAANSTQLGVICKQKTTNADATVTFWYLVIGQSVGG